MSGRLTVAPLPAPLSRATPPRFDTREGCGRIACPPRTHRDYGDRPSRRRKRLRDGGPEHILDLLGAARQHGEPVEPERDAGAFGHAVRERREEVLIDGVGDTVARLLA